MGIFNTLPNPANTNQIKTMPTSCSDLHQIGQIIPGFYSIKRNSNLLNVYCDQSGITFPSS